jgi:hypothetical protein
MSVFMTDSLLRRIAIVVVFSMIFISFMPRVEAAFVPSDESVSYGMRQKDMATVKKVLEHKLVTERLKALGYSETEVQTRLDQLSDSELHRFATQLDTLAPGGGALGVIISILVIIALVLVILHLSGKRIVIQ